MFLPIYKALKVWMTKEIHISKLKLAEKQEIQSEEGKEENSLSSFEALPVHSLDFICINGGIRAVCWKVTVIFQKSWAYPKKPQN